MDTTTVGLVAFCTAAVVFTRPTKQAHGMFDWYFFLLCVVGLVGALYLLAKGW